jgi:hypothetical protein
VSGAPRSPSREDLTNLAAKYATLSRLRRERASDGKLAERGALRALAREFPGSLRELDTVTLEEIERRERELRAASEGGPGEPWMAWMVAYHRTMRAALFVKARLARSGNEPGEIAALAALANRTLGLPIDEDFVRAVGRPPGGRLNRVVFERLAVSFGEPADHIWETLFPARRPGRY